MSYPLMPLVGVPPSIAKQLSCYRDVFCRESGFKHISRYVSGLLLSPNKTLQGIYAQSVGAEGVSVSRRAMHEAVFEAGWDIGAFMVKHRSVVARDHRGRGREIIGLDWTLAHHERGAGIFGVKRSYDYVEHRMSQHQCVITAVVSNRELIDGLAVVVQTPNWQAQEKGYLQMSAQQSYSEMAQVMQRLTELLAYQRNRLAYRKRTEIACEVVEQLEREGEFPQAHYAFDNGVLTLALTELIERNAKHWVSEIESSRLIVWNNQWQRVDAVAAGLRQDHPQSFRPVTVKKRNGEQQQMWAFTKVVRLRRYGRKRLVIVHEQADLSDAPRCLLTDAQHWESTRVIETWSYRWSSEIFHEFTKQVTGLESAQVRNEQAVKRHLGLSCLAQSLLQRCTAQGGKSERFRFANGTQTLGQKLYSLSREALAQLLEFAHALFAAGRSSCQVLEVLMPT